MESPSVPVTHCGSSSLQLHNLLRSLGYRAAFAGFDHKGGAGSHLFVQAVPRGGKPLLLDPSAGYVYLFSVADIGKETLPPPVVLPQVRDLDYLDLTRIKNREDYSFTTFSEFAPGVIYLRERQN